MKKKVLASLTALILAIGLMSPTVFADGSATVYVTIANGDLKMVQQPVTVTDVDEDGALTIYDAFYLAHEAAFDGGAAAGFAAEETTYGLSITKFWGVENGGSYSYYLNTIMAMGLTDEVKDGDYLDGFVFTDTTTFSDQYSYFNVRNAAVNAGQDLELTLSALSFDENFNTVVGPVADATITVNGQATEYKTDADGKVTIKFDTDGQFIVSAVSDTAVLVPPAVVVNATPLTGDFGFMPYVFLGLAALLMIGVLSFRRSHEA
ncbi:MAG: hypothetical protein IIY77_03335 [Lachnospiraceae bacterium]|nr:hypothetical protein [Lachnospiraceae bacterium]